MTTFNESLKKQVGVLFEVRWYPEDWGIPDEPCSTYVIAPDMKAACLAVSDNLFDIRSVARIANGGVINTLATP